MKRKTRSRTVSACRLAWLAMAVALLTGARVGLGAEPANGGDNDPQARFHGAPTYDFGVTNVTWEAGTKDYSFVTFDLSWSFSWRAKWTEPAKTSVTGKDIEVENWDAAWVFVKFLPEKESDEAKERNHWLHASLDKEPTNHVMPAGATNFVKLSDDGTRGMGVFIYRDAVGHGTNDWKKIKLRWNHPPVAAGARFDPAKAAVNVHAIAMVYVPEGPVKVGTGRPSGVAKFADGPDFPGVNNMANGRSKDQEFMALTDGSWRGGNSIPFLLDAEWNAPAKEGTRARRLGNHAGELWCTFTFWEVNLGWIGPPGPLPDEYPTGYDAFYCMKYELTQGQYVDFLNSLPPDVAAGRAFVGSEVSADYGIPSVTVKLPMGPGRAPRLLVENSGCTIYSSADLPQVVELQSSSSDDALVTEEDKKQKEALDNLVDGIVEDKKDRPKKSLAAAAATRPVYTARLPFRRLPGPVPSDVFAYAVWAGLRPMSQLEEAKAGNGARDPLAPPDWTLPKDRVSQPLLDEGLPTERYAKPEQARVWSQDIFPRVGIFATPTSDRGTARAAYWGISELATPFPPVMPLISRGFRGTHGNGITSPGKPGASFKRTIADFKDAPADWTKYWTYIGGHFEQLKCRLVASADNRIRKPAVEPAAPAPKAVAKPAAPIPPMDGRQDDLPRVTNVKVEPGKEFSTVSFDLAWKNSWRAKWTEPAEKNCTGKPLPVESWDAAWVFVKFRRPDTRVFSHATLSPDVAHHVKPAGAALDLGLNEDSTKGIGVFIYRDAVGQGLSEFKGIKLRWQNGADQADAATAELSVHPIPMVYVPEGSFRSKSPFSYAVGAHWTPAAYACQLTTIDTPDTTKPGGHVNCSTNFVGEGPDWPNGYGAFYCMKYSISQGEYARFLTEAAPDPKTATYNGKYRYGPWNAYRRYAPGLYGLCGYTIRYSAGEMRYEADVPERPANFLSDADIQSFTAWAGLRPLTKLEYEKACRGPRAAARDEDAWAPGACAPAVGLAQFVPSIGGYQAPTTGRLAWPGLSYWGIRDLSQSGAVIEWPAVVIEDGRGFTGNHGTGTPDPPGDWPFTSRCEWYVMGMWQGFPLSQIGVWIYPEDCMSMPGDIGAYISTRSGRYGARAVRSAGGKADKDAPLQVDALPNLAGYDIAIVNLAGRFKNDGDKPLKVELVSALPSAWLLQGDASRAFTAAAKAVTPFKVPVLLTRAVTNVTARGGRMLLLPLQIKGPGGEMLADASARLPADALSRPPSIVQSLDGGKIELKVRNATETPLTLSFEMASLPAVRIGESKRSITVAAGAEGVVAFPAPRQWFPQEGPCRIPYRLSVGGGAALDCEASVELQTQTRWWLTRRVKAEPKLGEDVDELLVGPQDRGGLDGLFSGAGDVFTQTNPPNGWKRLVCSSAVSLGKAGPLPTQESMAIGVTRAMVSRNISALVEVQKVALGPDKEGKVSLFLRVFVNEKLAFDSSLTLKERARPCQLREGVNTVSVEWQSNVVGETMASDVLVGFKDAKTGKPVSDLFFDMDKK